MNKLGIDPSQEHCHDYRILLDDHSLVRVGYRLILQQHMDMQVVGEASSHLTEGACEYTHEALYVLDEHVALSQSMFWDTRQVFAQI